MSSFFRLVIGVIAVVSVFSESKLFADSDAQSSKARATPLRCELQKSYLELFSTASQLRFSSAEIQREREVLHAEKYSCRNHFRSLSEQVAKKIDAARKVLRSKRATISQSERHDLHCRIQHLDSLRSHADMLSDHAIPVAYDNLNAKLNLLQRWPRQYRETKNQIANGDYMKRRWSDVQDIGFRRIAPDGQKEDIKYAAEYMKRARLMPADVSDTQIQEYVHAVALRVANNSDLSVPLHIRVLDSPDIDAFALPGGYIFVDRGLLQAVDDESELAGVLAHEIAHDAARHGARMKRRAAVAGISYEAAQAAAMFVTDGIASIGTYYGLETGYYGLGMALDLQMLGVNRKHELEADRLGVQYAWKANYNPSGFIRFFDKMATQNGDLNGVSWFRTHPPFYQRMAQAEREIMFLGNQSDPTVQTSAFLKMKETLDSVAGETEREQAGSGVALPGNESGCPASEDFEYKPSEPTEEVCARVLRSAERER